MNKRRSGSYTTYEFAQESNMVPAITTSSGKEKKQVNPHFGRPLFIDDSKGVLFFDYWYLDFIY